MKLSMLLPLILCSCTLSEMQITRILEHTTKILTEILVSQQCKEPINGTTTLPKPLSDAATR